MHSFRASSTAVGDRHGAVELFAGVHHAVADGEDFAFVLDHAGLGAGEVVDDQLDAFLVVGDVVRDDVLFFALIVVQDRALDADPFQQALGQHHAGFHVDQLEFDRRTAAVDDQNFHCSLFCRRIFNLNYNAFSPKINRKNYIFNFISSACRDTVFVNVCAEALSDV